MSTNTKKLSAFDRLLGIVVGLCIWGAIVCVGMVVAVLAWRMVS